MKEQQQDLKGQLTEFELNPLALIFHVIKW